MIARQILVALLTAGAAGAAGPPMAAGTTGHAGMSAAAEAAPLTGSVDRVRIAAVEGETEIRIYTAGEVRVDAFVLSSPPRLIVDVAGAAHALPRPVFEGIGRGGVVRLRTSQFRDEVVRLVFELAALPDYTTERGAGWFAVRFPNPGGAFHAWNTASADRADEAWAMSDEAPAPDLGVGGAATGPSDVAPSSPASPPRITVAYDSASMLDVLAGFSEFAGISIVPSSDVADVVVRGVDIRNQSWDVALDAILSAQGLGWRQEAEGILIVDQLADLRARDTLSVETRVFRINYASADSVAATLAELATPSHGQVVAYQGANSVIVTDVPASVARMDTLIQMLDRKIPQVSIEAKIIFVSRTDVNELGIVYDLKDRTGNSINDVIAVPDPFNPGETTNETLVDLSGSSIAALANANDRLAAPALQILASVAFGDFSLAAFIDALESHQLSDVQASPSIQVVDNHHARIQVGEKTPIRILESGAEFDQARVNVQFENTGIILNVTPHITNNGQILLDLAAERSGLQLGLADVGFTFEKQIGETRLLLDDGETAVIGGLTLSEVTRSESGIPGLMDVPVLGSLFRTTKSEETKTDLIFLVTPHIVEPVAPPGGDGIRR